MRSVNKYIFLFPIIIVALILLFNFSACEPREKLIKIGNQTVLTGEYKFYGEDQLVSIELAASELSPVKIGGFEYKIDIITKDDEGNAERAFLVSQELVEEGVLGVIGSTFNGTTKVSIPVYEEYNIPIITPSAQGVELSKTGNNFFRLIMNNKQKIDNIAAFLMDEIKPRKLILIDNRDEYSVSLIDFLIEIFEDLGFSYNKRYAVDMESEGTGILAENLLIDEPDAIFFCGYYDELAKLITEVREIGLETQFITEEIGMDERISLFTDEQFLEGLIAIISEPPSLAKYSEDKRAIDFSLYKYPEFAEKMENIELSQYTPGPYSFYSYDALYLIIDAMKRANSILPEDYIDQLKLSSYDGIIGKIEFNSNGDRIDPPSTVFIIKNGDWVRY
ncbi:MAG: branched-chain amino acid ABC transporter substrate-binding protein [Actinobacteria bacterium]|nr:branched-chain amino acid ABC transporter substrate-binding protein [Actinomycetota bacterium]